MTNKKNIDNLFKEKFEDFEVLPNDIVWQNIEEKLKEKKKRRVLPFWWKFSGVAALLLVGFFIGQNVSNKNNVEIDSSKSVVNSDKNKEANLDATNNNDAVTSNNNNSLKNNSNSQSNINQKDENTKFNSGVIEDKAVTNTSTSDKNASSIISSEKKGVKKTKTSTLNEATILEKNNIQISENNTNRRTIIKNKTSAEDKNNDGKIDLNYNNNNQISEKNNHNKSTLNNKTYVIENNISNDKIAMNHENIELKGDPITKQDSVKTALVETNKLEELLKEKENKIAVEQKISRLQVAPNLAPIYFSSLSNGSPLDERFAQNTKQYNTNLSYGVMVNYALNKKMKIRAGINALSVTYGTSDIMFSQTQNSTKALKNVQPNLQGSLIEIEPIKNVNINFNRMGKERFDGLLNQKIGYIEMPLEFSYALLNKKIGVDLIAGMSSLLLNQNEVVLQADGMNMKIGEATNLNNLHFSSNIGLGFNYRFYKKFDARIEPVFKYQLNTFSSDAGNFKPYIFGIYSGVSYNF